MAQRTYAQQAKTIMNKYKLRLGDKFDKGDPLALASMNAELTTLQETQEKARAVKFEADNANEISAIQQFANGGKLNKKQQSTLSKLLPQYEHGGFHFPEGKTTETFTPGGGEGSWITGDTQASVAGDGETNAFKSRVPWAGAVGQGIGNFLANKEIDLPEFEYEEYKPTQARANRVDYSRGREQTLRERDQAQALITSGARGTGSQAGLMENILAGATGTQRVAGEAFNKSLEQEANINAQIETQTSQFNAAQAAQAGQMNMRGKMFETQLGRENVMVNEERRGNRIGAITGAVSGYLGDKSRADQYDQMVNMEIARNPNFGLQQKDPTFWRKLAGITDPIENINFTNTGDTLI